MITFSFEKEIAHLHSAWNEWKWAAMDNDNRASEFVEFRIAGFYGCGKHEFIRQYIQRDKTAKFISFRGLTGQEALTSFCKQHLDGHEAKTWAEAAKRFKTQLDRQFVMFIVDSDEQSDVYKEFESTFHNAHRFGRIYVDRVTVTAPGSKRIPGSINPRSIVDFMKLFPAYSSAEAICLQGLTGGLPAVARELDADLTYADNLRLLLGHGSAFSRMLPAVLERLFRSPDSYHPIMYSIATGKHRLSEIAKDVGFPNNKCGKYLEALIQAGFVIAPKEDKNGYARYYLSNSYLNSWYLYVYKNRSMQIAEPQKLYNMVKKTSGRYIAMPALYAACRRYIENSVTKDIYGVFDAYTEGREKSLSLKHESGAKVRFDFVLEYDRRTLLCVYPRSFDEKYTKEQMQHYIQAAKLYGSLEDDVSLFVFSCSRFSDWCVHQAAEYPQLFCVTANRLKY